MRAPRSALLLAVIATLAPALAGCPARPDDPALAALRRTLERGEKLIASRDFGPEGDGFAAVVARRDGAPELRIFRRGPGGGYDVDLTARQGDTFRELVLEDVDVDGRDEVVVLWKGGHLEMIEVFGRTADGGWRALFENAGRTIERRRGPEGAMELWITSRTYEERAGEPPAWTTAVYRWRDGAFSEAARR